MLELMEKVFFLKKVPLFSRLEFSNLIQMAKIMEEVALAPQQYFFRQGESGDALYVLLDGEADVLLDDRVINTMKAGQSFGEIAVLDNAPRTASVKAKCDVYALKISRQAFDQLFAQESELRSAVIEELSSRLMAIRKRERSLLLQAQTK